MFNCSISFASLNVRGLKDLVKRKALFLFCKGRKANCFLLQETHSSDLDARFWSNQWGDRIIFSHGTNKSAGVAICFNRFPGEVITYRADGHGHWLVVVVKVDSHFLIISNVYGYRTNAQNKQMLEDITNSVLELKIGYPTDFILMAGDWNMTPDEWEDRWPSKFNSHHFNNTIGEFITKNGLIDIWRSCNPGIKQYSWYKPNNTCKSRIDYWLVPDSLRNFASDTLISKAPLTDHCMIEMTLNSVVRIRKNKAYWKFNSSLLKNEEYCAMIKGLIMEIENSCNIDDFCNKWEFLKYRIREQSIQFSKKITMIKRREESTLFQELNEYCDKTELSSDDNLKFMALQAKLDDLYCKRAKGAFVRSRAKWIEEGEKNTSYFCNLEKRRHEKKAVSSLLIKGVECKEAKIIEKEVFMFYSNLYRSTYSQLDSISFFNKIKNFIPKIDNSFKELCELDLRLEELDEMCLRLSLNKSPGADGLTTEFYRFFWKEIRQLVFNAIQECIERKELMTTMKQGLIILIPKHGKDKRLLDNLRPITLLNTDYKLLSGVIAARIKKGVSQIINETQSGFLSGRSIHNNIRLVLDLIDYSDTLIDQGFIIFLDFYKAFDSVEHPFILDTLNYFGFGQKFTNLISVLYSDINSCVSLEHGTCPRFPIKRGIRQGCNSSPLLFLMVAELLSIMIKNNEIEGFNILGKHIIISQFADDTTLFLKDERQISLALDSINQFSKASGVTLNTNKCEIFALHEQPLCLIGNIKVKKEIKYLGITITRNKEIRERENILRNIDKCKLILNSWLQRDITVFGRILLSKTESLSRAIYPAFSLEISDNIIKLINRINFNFIWKNKCHYIRKADMIKSIEEGGMNVIDFSVMNGVLKLKWLSSFVNHKDSFWFTIPNAIFQKLGGIDLFLRCDYDLCKLPVKLSDFHKQVLLYWNLRFKHNFTPHNTPLWNNRYIICNKRSIFLKSWMDKDIWSVTQLMDKTGNLLQYREFCNIFDFHCPVSEFNKVLKAIPKTFISMSQQIVIYSNTAPIMRTLCIEDINVCSKQFTNKFIRKVLINQLYPGQVKRNYILKEFGEDVARKIRKRYLDYPVFPKAKEVTFKILNKIYPSNYFLHNRFNWENNSCSFCQTDIETVDHMFFHCTLLQDFWTAFQGWIQSKNISIDPLNVTSIMIGIFLKDKNLEFLVNILIVLAKHYIHKCKYLKVRPHFVGWFNDLRTQVNSLRFVKSKSACNFISIVDMLLLLE